MNSLPSDKASLRRILREQRRALNQEQQTAASANAARNLCEMPHWEQLQHIALYIAADGELDPAPIAAFCRCTGRSLYLPRLMDGKSMCFARWAPDAKLLPNRFGIPEPDADAPVRSPDELDLVLLPLVGWDRGGNRLGMGAGFYDRTLATGRPRVLAGLAHSTQEVDRLPADSWDVGLDYVVNELELVRCRRTND